MLLLRVPEQIGAFEHPRYSFDRRSVEWDNARLVSFLLRRTCRSRLTRSGIPPADVLHLHRTHPRVGRDDCGAVDVLPFRIGGGDVEQAAPLLARQRSADGPLTLRQVLDVISQRSPPATELQHPRQHANIVSIDARSAEASLRKPALEARDRAQARDVGRTVVSSARSDQLPQVCRSVACAAASAQL